VLLQWEHDTPTADLCQLLIHCAASTYLMASPLRASTLVSRPPIAPLLSVGRKPMTATKTVRIPHAGCQYSGWYPVILRHTFLCSSNRPLGYVWGACHEYMMAKVGLFFFLVAKVLAHLLSKTSDWVERTGSC